MRHKKMIAILLLGGVLLGAVGGVIALMFREKELTEQTNQTAEQEQVEIPKGISPGMEYYPKEPTEETEKRADLELDVGEIIRQTSPVYIGGSVEYGNKEVPTNEELP